MEIVENNNKVEVTCSFCKSILRINQDDVDFVPPSGTGMREDEADLEFLLYVSYNVLCPCCSNQFKVNDEIPTQWASELYFEFYE